MQSNSGVRRQAKVSVSYRRLLFHLEFSHISAFDCVKWKVVSLRCGFSCPLCRSDLFLYCRIESESGRLSEKGRNPVYLLNTHTPMVYKNIQHHPAKQTHTNMHTRRSFGGARAPHITDKHNSASTNTNGNHSKHAFINSLCCCAV